MSGVGIQARRVGSRLPPAPTEFNAGTSDNEVELTEDGDDNDDEIEHVPRLLEEVQAQTDELEGTFGGDVKKCRRRLTSLWTHSVVV